LLRAATPRAAESAADLLRALQGSSTDAIRRRIADEMTSSLSFDAYRERSERVRGATRFLAGASDVYAALLFLGLPVLIWFQHSERALWIAGPVLLALHLVTLVALIVARRRLFPGLRGELIEQVIACAIYPPALLHGLQDLAHQLLDGFHPALVAAVHLPKRERNRFLRGELGRVDLAARLAPPHAIGLAELEREALEALLEECDSSRESLLAPPLREDPLALAYCPICGVEYRIAQGSCGDCGVELTRYDAAE
jgi:hypothetical protein